MKLVSKAKAKAMWHIIEERESETLCHWRLPEKHEHVFLRIEYVNHYRVCLKCLKVYHLKGALFI